MTKELLFSLIRVMLYALPAAFILPLATYFKLGPIGDSALYDEYNSWSLVILPAIVMFLVPSILLCFFKRTIKTGIHGIVWSVSLFSYTLAGLVMSIVIENQALLALTERSKPLIAAIKQFETANKKPPVSLKSLVPSYISKVPDTGMPAYPNFELRTGEKELGAARWELAVHITREHGQADEFYYQPEQNYEANVRGYFRKRIGDWIYADWEPSL